MRIKVKHPADPNTQSSRVERILRDAIRDGITDMEIIGDGLNYGYVPSLIWGLSKELWEEALDKAFTSYPRYRKGNVYREALVRGHTKYISVRQATFGGRRHVFVHIDFDYPDECLKELYPRMKEEREALLRFDQNWNTRREHGITRSYPTQTGT